jgi:hypothetical protein
MIPPLDVHVPIPILQSVAGPRISLIASEGLGGLSLTGIRERSGSSGAASRAVDRAIQDLKGSGYRPLHPDPARPQRASMPGYGLIRVARLTPIPV